jgi:TolA-binding protein
MNREKARQILGENATEEQVTNFLNEWHNAKKEESKQYESQLNELQEKINQYSDYDEIKTKLNEINKANMTEQEKMEEQKKEIANNLSNSRKIYNKAKAMEILAGENVEESIIDSLVTDNLETTVATINALKANLTAIKDSVANKTKETLSTLNTTPTISNVPQNDSMTMDKFFSLSAEEQEKFVNEHPQEFENLI